MPRIFEIFHPRCSKLLIIGGVKTGNIAGGKAAGIDTTPSFGQLITINIISFCLLTKHVNSILDITRCNRKTPLFQME
jgi:hypothetical protein